jgi:alpha-1,2-mannosyltransferase
MVASQGELTRPTSSQPARLPADGRRGLFLGLAVFAVLLAAYVADLLDHRLLNWFDLQVYAEVGYVARHDPGHVYTWSLDRRKFTYTPFAALVAIALRALPLLTLERVVTAISVVTIPVATWVTFGGLGWRGARRVGAALALAGVALWLEPVQRALQLGQIEVPMMLLIAWDLCQPDRRKLKGLGVGLAAGIKLVPLIFIPYLLLAGKIRQAAMATTAFAVTALLGLIFLPRTFSKYWLSGYFLHPSGLGPQGGLRNQSMFGTFARLTGSLNAARPWWLVASLIVGVAGMVAAAVLHRAGQPVAGWVTCSLTALLISPISWDHHWVWIVPALAVFIDWAVRAEGIRRQAWWAAGIAMVLLFGAYPHSLHGYHAYEPIGGLLGIIRHKPTAPHIELVHPGLLLTWNLFVLAGLALLATMLVTAWRTHLLPTLVKQNGVLRFAQNRHTPSGAA